MLRLKEITVATYVVVQACSYPSDADTVRQSRHWTERRGGSLACPHAHDSETVIHKKLHTACYAYDKFNEYKNRHGLGIVRLFDSRN